MIKYIPINLEAQVILEDMGCYLKLHPESIEYNLSFYAEDLIDSEDKSLGYKQQNHNFNVILLKKNILGVEKILTDNNFWKIHIIFPGIEGPKLYYKKEKDAEEVMHKILKYILS